MKTLPCLLCPIGLDGPIILRAQGTAGGEPESVSWTCQTDPAHKSDVTTAEIIGVADNPTLFPFLLDGPLGAHQGDVPVNNKVGINQLVTPPVSQVQAPTPKPPPNDNTSSSRSYDSSGVTVNTEPTIQAVGGDPVTGQFDPGFIGQGLQAALAAFAATSDTYGSVGQFYPLKGGIRVELLHTFSVADQAFTYVFPRGRAPISGNIVFTVRARGLGLVNSLGTAIGMTYVPRGTDLDPLKNDPKGELCHWLQVVGCTDVTFLTQNNFGPTNQTGIAPGMPGSGIGVSGGFYWVLDGPARLLGDTPPGQMHQPWYTQPRDTKPASTWETFTDASLALASRAPMTLQFATFKAWWISNEDPGATFIGFDYTGSSYPVSPPFGGQLNCNISFPQGPKYVIFPALAPGGNLAAAIAANVGSLLVPCGDGGDFQVGVIQTSGPPFVKNRPAADNPGWYSPPGSGMKAATPVKGQIAISQFGVGWKYTLKLPGVP